MEIWPDVNTEATITIGRYVINDPERKVYIEIEPSAEDGPLVVVSREHAQQIIETLKRCINA